MYEKHKTKRQKIMTTETLRYFLSEHPRINLLQYILRKKITSSNKCREMLELEKSPLVVRYCHYGKLNYGKPVYHIVMREGYRIMGYCGLLRATLLHIAYAERMGFIPVVDWGPELLYSEADCIHGTNNSFEYFFNNTSKVALEDIAHSYLVVHSKVYDIQMFSKQMSYYIDNNELDILSETIRSNLRFNIYGLQEVVAPCREIIKRGKILGLHIRGTDFKDGFSRHPIMAVTEEYLEIAKEIVAEGNYDYVFLATDEEKVLQDALIKFGEKLLYFDIPRSIDGKPLHYGKPKKREKNKYLLGKEILRDVYMLGECAGLVAGLSSVPIIARAFKKSTGRFYEHLEIIDKGLHTNMKESSLYIRN